MKHFPQCRKVEFISSENYDSNGRPTNAVAPTTYYCCFEKTKSGVYLFVSICVVDCQKKDSEMGKLKELSVSVSRCDFIP